LDVRRDAFIFKAHGTLEGKVERTLMSESTLLDEETYLSRAIVTNEITTLLRRVITAAESHFHRHTVVFAGDPLWCYRQASQAADLFDQSQCLWVGKQHPSTGHTLAVSRVQHHLGMEHYAVVFDGFSGFDPDMFAAVAGTVKGGGLMILMCPPLEQWEGFNDPQKSRLAIWPYSAVDISGRFLRLVARAFRQDKAVVIVEQDRPLPSIQWSQPPWHISATDKKSTVSPQSLFPCLTEDQQLAVQSILHVVSGHRHRPLVITSDRGRGKSAALGIAAARLLEQGVSKIIVTAPRQAAVAQVFQCAEKLLPGAFLGKGELSVAGASMVFVAADELVRRHHECNILMVDEAAAIPASLLEHYLRHYARVVFSTTVHGYEGTGRGFVLRFHHTLDRYTPDWRTVQLDTPIRWARNDPLETLVFKALLLDAEPCGDEIAGSANTDNCRFEKIDRDILVDDAGSLNQLFALLVLAHYQTQPADLRYLLDARNVHIYVLRRDKHIVAAALLEEEGRIDAGLAEEIYANRRRVHGHLLAQSLAVYAGMPQAPLLKYLRVMRIAVHPVVQKKGLGSLMLRKIEATLSQAGFDLWGASFGAAPELMRFWNKAGFSPVHIGLNRNAASGKPSALVLKAVSDGAENFLTTVGQKFSRHFPYMLAEVYRDLDSSLIRELMDSNLAPWTEPIDEADWQDINSFVNSARGYEVNSVPVWKLVCAAVRNRSCVEPLTETEYELLVGKVLQKNTWFQVVAALGFNGQKQAVDCLRETLKKLLKSANFKGRLLDNKLANNMANNLPKKE
jgi:tRNA(Met) cytidine acetyltransferase